MQFPTRRARSLLQLVRGVAVTTAVFASGCAAITGLDQFAKGTDDASIEDATVADQSADSRSDTTVVDSTLLDTSQMDSNTLDAGADGSDTGDAGCGPTNTIDNCSMCGSKCGTANVTDASCTGTSCQYVCKMGYSNCDASPPDLGGCECATPMCCGASCATDHTNGVGQSFYDCVAKGTYDQQQALKACTAYTGNQFACSMASCISDGGDMVVCGAINNSCVCWDYVGATVSHVYKSGSSTCFCPSTIDPTWN